MRSLLWKEWHEQSWKLAFSCILLGAMAAIGLRARIVTDSEMIVWVCMIGALLPISYSAGLLPAERADKTFESLIALPIHPRKILLAKTFAGLALCLIPLLTAGLISLSIAGGREITYSSMITMYAKAMLLTVMFFLWMFALTSQLPNETRAALLNVGTILCLTLIFGTSEFAAVQWLSLISPLSTLMTKNQWGGTEYQMTVLPVAIQVAIAAVLWFWTSRRFAVPVEEQR